MNLTQLTDVIARSGPEVREVINIIATAYAEYLEGASCGKYDYEVPLDEYVDAACLFPDDVLSIFYAQCNPRD